jgi:hypothetical protein
MRYAKINFAKKLWNQGELGAGIGEGNEEIHAEQKPRNEMFEIWEEKLSRELRGLNFVSSQ